MAATEKSDGMSMAELSVVCTYFLSLKNKKGVSARNALCALHHNCGRGGELSNTTMSQLKFDQEFGCLVIDWSMHKVFKGKVVPSFVNFKDFKICFFNSLFCYFVSMREDTPDPDGFAFSELQVQQVAGKVDGFIKDFYDRAPKHLVQQVLEGLTSKVTHSHTHTHTHTTHSLTHTHPHTRTHTLAHTHDHSQHRRVSGRALPTSWPIE
jgi:hypothetical protein